MAETSTQFDTKAYIAEQNASEQAKQNGTKPAEAETKQQTAETKPSKPAEKQEEEAPVHLPRSVRRELNKLREEKARAEGRLQAYEELRAKGGDSAAAGASSSAHSEETEPQRAAFATDAEYHRAIGRWEAGREVDKKLREAEEKSEATRSQERFLETVRKMDEKFIADAKEFQDWDKAVEQATKNLDEDESLQWSSADHPIFTALIAQSDQRAAVLYHFAQNPDDLRKFLDMDEGEQQIRAFSRLEGRLEKQYAKSEENKAEHSGGAYEKASVAERDAKLAKPSETVAARGGTGAASTVSMFLADGKTLNPVWKAQENQRQGVRP